MDFRINTWKSLISWRNLICSFSCILLLVHSLETRAGAADYVNLTAIGNFTFGTWAAGDGNQSRTDLHCASSANWNNAFSISWWFLVFLNPRPTVLPYNFEVVNISSVGPFYLYRNGDPGMTGNSRIQISMSHRDVRIGTGYEVLSDGVYDSHNHNGLYQNCIDGNNSELQVSILSSDMEKARAGTYLANFAADIQGGITGTTQSGSQSFSASLDIANIVKVLNLDNINLGAWSGSGAINQAETFCVYSNNGAGSYELTLSSSNQDAGGNFFAVNPGATRTIPYTLQFIDSAMIPGGTTVGLLPIAGNGSNSSLVCGGSDNARITVTISQVNLAASGTDTYSDTILLVVAPI